MSQDLIVCLSADICEYNSLPYFSIRTVVNSGKICVLNLQPSSLPNIHESDLKPYVVFLTPPPPQLSRQQANKHGQLFKVNWLAVRERELLNNKYL